MRLVVRTMDLDDINEVLEVDRESYTLPWPASAYRRELLHNRNARYFVLRQVPDNASERRQPSSDADNRARFNFGFLWRPRKEEPMQEKDRSIVGYAGMWLMVDEAHITTIAVRDQWRGKGLGELLLARLIEAAAEAGTQRVTLEVRVSNDVAQALYRKYGFQTEGLRPRYYSDNNEDAYIMTTSNIHDETYRQMFEQNVTTLRSRLHREVDPGIAVPEGEIGFDRGEAGVEP